MKTQHPTIAELDRNERSFKAASLITSPGKEQQFFEVLDNESEKATNVRFQITWKIAASGKCFTDGEFVKKSMLLAALELCLEKMRMLRNISLSRLTVERRVADIAANLTDQLKQKVKEFLANFRQ